MIDFPNYLLLLSSPLRNCLFSPLHLQTEREDLLVMFFTLSWMLWILLTQMGW